MSAQFPILDFLFPWAAALAALAVCLFSLKLSKLLVWAGLLGGLFFSLESISTLLSQGNWHYELGGWAPPWGVELVWTPFSCVLGAFFWFLSASTFFYMGFPGGFGKTKNPFLPGLFLALVSSLGALLLVRDGFTLYLFLEISLVSASAILALSGEKTGLDAFYFLLGGSTGLSLLLLGVVFLYGATGTVQLDDLLAQLFATKNYSMAWVGGVFFTAAFGFHFCFPLPTFFSRLLRRAPPFFMGFFSAAAVRAAAYLLFVFVFFAVNVPGLVQPPWLWVPEYSLAVLFLAAFVHAARQKDFRHALGFLSVAQLGYLFLGMVLGNKSGLTGTLVELLNQTLVIAGLFFIAGTLKESPGPHPISRMAGLGRHRPLTGICLVIFAASILGVPPTVGFFGKWYLVQGAMENRDWVVLGAVLASCLFNLFYFGKFTLFLYEHKAPSVAHGPASFSRRTPFLLMAAMVLILGIFHQGVIRRFVEPALPKVFLNIQMPNVPFLGQQVE